MERSESRFIKESGEEFSRAMDRATKWIIDYFGHPERYPVLSQVEPGDILKSFPNHPPEEGCTYDMLLDDFEHKILPGITHWNHPSFFAYFAISGSYPGILGEYLSGALNVNGMLWRTSPALTELETLSLNYLRDMLGLAPDFFGMILDTASTSSLIAAAAARETVPGLDIRDKGMAGRSDLPPLVLYTSKESHSSIEKAAILLGIGRSNVRKIDTDESFRMDVRALERLIRKDIDDGLTPFCVVATVGTTSTTSIDPVPEIAEICREFGVWLHVDAAYAGMAAILPEKRDVLAGCNEADSLVVNPHKWLFTPIDLSAFYCKKPGILKQACSLVPEYLQTRDDGDVINLMDYGFQLGRRFRSLKLWMVINYYGVKGLQDLIRNHLRLASELLEWLSAHPWFELMAPAPFSTICFRLNPTNLSRSGSALAEDELNRMNEAFLADINASGRVFLSHTKIGESYALRCAIGNIRTTDSHIRALCELLEDKAKGAIEGSDHSGRA